MADNAAGGSYQLDDARLVGHEYNVRLSYTVEYDLTVTAGPEKFQAVQEAELLRFANDVEPSERDLVHSDVEAIGDIFEDDPNAHEVAEWIGAPSAPSEDTFWDDSVHFDDRHVDTVTDDTRGDAQ